MSTDIGLNKITGEKFDGEEITGKLRYSSIQIDPMRMMGKTAWDDMQAYSTANEFDTAQSPRLFIVGLIVFLLVLSVLFYVLTVMLPFGYYDEFQIAVTPFMFYAALHYSRKIIYLTTFLCYSYVIAVDHFLLQCRFETYVTVTFVCISILAAQELIYRMLTLQRKLQTENKMLTENLKLQIGKVKRLSELLPICRVCNKLRTDEDAWKDFETFLKKELHIEMSEGICPDCLKEILSNFDEREKELSE